MNGWVPLAIIGGIFFGIMAAHGNRDLSDRRAVRQGQITIDGKAYALQPMVKPED